MLINIRALRLEDLSEISTWFELDSDFPGDFSPFSWNISKESFISKIQDTLAESKYSEVKFYAVLKDNTPIGLLLARRPENFDFYEIGFYIVPSERGRGYGSESVRQLMDFLFKNRRILRIEAGTSSLNLPSQRLLEKVGFAIEVIRRKTLFRNGTWEDSYLYALIIE